MAESRSKSPAPSYRTQASQPPAYEPRQQPIAQASSLPPVQEDSQHTGKDTRSMKQQYKDWKMARAQKRTIEAYQRQYGFVPKNLMTEQEWQNAKERAAVKKPVDFKKRFSRSSIIDAGFTAALM